MKRVIRWGCLLGVLATHSVSGAWYYWQGTGGSGVGDYEATNNWSTGVLPGIADSAAFKNTANKNWRVTLTSNVTNLTILNDISAFGSETVFNLGQKTWTSTDTGQGIYVRYGTGGKVTFTNGTLACYKLNCQVEPSTGATTLSNHAFIAFQTISSESYVAYFAGSTATFDGGAHSVTNLMRVGNMTNASACATVRLVGGTRFGVTNEVYVGGISGSTGRLEVADAAFRMGKANNYVGHFANSEGTFTVGAGADVFSPGRLWCGSSGRGVYAQAGGSVTAPAGVTLGELAGGWGEMILAGGSFLSTGTAAHVVGSVGFGQLTVLDGTNTFGGNVTVGDASGGVGRMAVTGGNNTFGKIAATRLTVGRMGAGTLSASGGTNATCGIILGHETGGTGAMTVSNGLWTVDEHMWVGFVTGGNGALTVAGGEIRFLNGGPVLALGRNANATGEVTVAGGLLNVNGNVYMGGPNGVARLTLAGSGVLRAKALYEYDGAASSYVLFDGGTLQASASGTLIQALDDVRLTATGMAVDTAGNTVSVVPILQDAPGEAGGITKKGTGTLTLAGARAATGPVSVLGGTLVVSNNVSVSAGVSRIDGTLTLTADNRLTVGAGAALAGTGSVARVTLADKAKLVRSKTDGATSPLNVSDCYASGALTVDISGYTRTDLLAALPLLKVPSAAFNKPTSVSVLRDGVPDPSVIVRCSESGGSTVLSAVYNSGTMISVR
ncbi:MAG TPA: hypothetical protein PKM57_07855 [Kiritimatiellia bacterium]|nr:hypothetical protein [Kiritimatiellia bacterium]HPS06789.1 hypothetical protein [Kiritimatiellia bacterium]